MIPTEEDSEWFKDLPFDVQDQIRKDGGPFGTSIQDGVWYRDHAASGWRSRMWVGDKWEALVYDEGEWEVRGPPIGHTVAQGKEANAELGKVRALKVLEALR